MAQLRNKPYTSRDKWIMAIIVGLLFILMASPYLFSVINNCTSMFGVTLSSQDGRPTIAGLAINAILFMFIIRLLLR